MSSACARVSYAGMESMLVAIRRAPPTTAFMLVALPAATLDVWFNAMFNQGIIAPEWAFGGPILLETVLLATLGASFGVWVSLHLAGLVGSGTGAGFRLALLGFASRTASDLLLSYAATDVDAAGLVYRATYHAGGALWLVRNGSLVCYGFGLALVVLSTAIELRRRRRTPAWTRPAD